MYYTGLGQSLSTDPAQYVFHARNKILFGAFDPFDYPRWTVYEHSLTSLVAYLWFSVKGVSLQNANMVGVLLSLGGLLFLILGLMRYHRPWVTAVIAFCYVINVTLLTYGRLSYLENGLIFLTAAVFLVYVRWGYRLWGVVLAGGLAALAMLTGKLFGALLLPALVLAILFSGRNRRWRDAVTSVVSFAITSVVAVMLLYGSDLPAAVRYAQEQSLGLWGFPRGLTSPWSFFEHLIAYGFENHLYFLDVDLLLFLFVSFLLLCLHLNRQRRLGTLPPTIQLLVFWVSLGILAFSPLNYSPLRYALLVIPPMILLCFALLDTSLDAQGITLARPGRMETVLLIFAFWIVLFHSVGNIFFLDTLPRPIRALTWATLPAAVGLAFLVRSVLTRRTVHISRRMMIIASTVLVAFSTVFNSIQIYRKHIREHNFNIAEANLDLQHILGPDAVVSGPYAPALTVDTDRMAFIHLFGVAKVDTTLFDRYPVTHLVSDVSNWKQAVKDYPALAEVTPITTYWIRDVEVRLFNISKVFNNPKARSYQETDYEKAVQYYQKGQYDTAGVLSYQFYQNHPESKSGGLLLADILMKFGKYDETYTLLTSLAKRFPTDFNIQFQCGRFIQIYAAMKKDSNLQMMALQHYDQAVRVDPYKGDWANRLWQETDNLIRQRISP
jgi:4-amino-4-deoxy-L-arabinose transferase-like glycosyltransferase